MENKPFLNRDRIFITDNKVLLCEDTYNYWLKENDKQINSRFHRQELFVLENQFT